MDGERERTTRKLRVRKLVRTLKKTSRPIGEKHRGAKIDLNPTARRVSTTTLETTTVEMPPKRAVPAPAPAPARRVAPKLVIKEAPSVAAAAAASSSSTPAVSLPVPPYNDAFIKVLGRLNEMLQAQGDVFRARAYKKAQETIQTITHDIISVDELVGLPAIGETIIEKLKEYVSTGTLRLFEKEKDNPIYVLTGVYGIGPKKADELVKVHGIRTIAQLREKQDTLLNDKQRIGLKYYEDILERIPRAEIDEYERVLKGAFSRVAMPTSHFEIVGSYRRGAEESGDIDVIITDRAGDSSVFPKFLDELRGAGLVIETLSEGKTKSLAISQLEGRPARRIDFLFSPPQEYAFAVLYFTGSASFNVVMRQYALNRGFTLSEHGLYHGTASGKGDKVDIIMEDEAAIFEFLGLEYKAPKERVDGRAVVAKKTPIAATGAGGDDDGEDEAGAGTSPSPVNSVEKSVAAALVGDAAADDVITTSNIETAIPPEVVDEISAMEAAKQAAIDAARKVAASGLPPPIRRVGEEGEVAGAAASSTKQVIRRKAPTLKIKEPIAMPEPASAAVAAAAAAPPAPPAPKRTSLKIKKETKAMVKELHSIAADLAKFKERGIDHLDSLSSTTLAQMIATANDAYYNSTPLLTDAQYDIIKEYLERKDPTHPVLKMIGAPTKKDKVALPFFMGSMDKIKPDTGALLEWKRRYPGPYVLSAKLDGISGLYVVDPDGTPHLYTRGDGSIGQDITHVIPYLTLPRTPGIAIRGELIMTKTMFKTVYADLGAANSRNLVAGILNRKTRTPEDYRKIDFVAYEVIQPAGLKPSAQMEMLAAETVDKVVSRVVAPKDLTNEMLSELLVELRESYDYEIDGVIVSNDAVYPRKEGNPEHAFAFKMLLTDQIVEAKVVDVLWAASKDGYLKPRVRIEPVVIGGATIEFATAFNAAFVEENGIGIGAVVRLVRSGDVIPHILSVEVAAPEAKMPEVAYRWNDTHVDVVLEDKSADADVRMKVIASFLKTLSVDGAGEGNVAKMTRAGYDTIPKVLAMSVSDYMKVEGFGEKLATKIQRGIEQAVEKAELPLLMDATNLFGRGMGERRIKEIMRVFPDILTSPDSAETKMRKIITIKGFAGKTAEQFVENIPAFLAFLEETGLTHKLDGATGAEVGVGVSAAAATASAAIDTSHPLYGKTVVMTGFRDKELAAAIEAVGGKVADSVSKKTSYVILKDVTDTSTKANKARELGIPLIQVDEFKKML